MKSWGWRLRRTGKYSDLTIKTVKESTEADRLILWDLSFTETEQYYERAS